MESRRLLELEAIYAAELPQLVVRWEPQPVAAPALLRLNEPLAIELGLDLERLRAPEGVDVLAGNSIVPGSTPVAMAYAGHQFGGYSPQLGDGRALLLGELRDRDGQLRDVHLKGSGRTPFARGGDGRAALGPMLRELLMGEAMHALGIPTTRMLAVVTTGEAIVREVDGAPAGVPGAVLTRIAASHLRVGTFQYAAATRDPTLLRALAHHAMVRHAPRALDAPNPSLALYEHVVQAQAELIAAWMLVGFIHGVMNTDNMTISGETIDYGPCAFIDVHDPATVFSSIDHSGRYAFGNQPAIGAWNLARLAEAMLPLLADDPTDAVAAATGVLETFVPRLQRAWLAGMRDKLGLGRAVTDDEAGEVANRFLALLTEQRADHTQAHRALGAAVRGDAGPMRTLLDDPDAFEHWAARWRPLVDTSAIPDEVAARMDRVNPVHVPRNHLVDEALRAATSGDLAPFDELLAVVREPYVPRPGWERYAAPAPPAFAAGFRTYCGT